MGSIFSGASGESADKTILYSATSGAAVNAQAYFMAALTATTPEVRAFLSGYSNQSLAGHEAMMSYMIEKGWTNPYDQPESQLSKVVQESTSGNSNQ